MKSNLKFLTLSLFILLVQNSLAVEVKYEAGDGSHAYSEWTVAVGINNEAGDSTKPTEKFFASAFGSFNKASGKWSSAFGYKSTASGLSSSAFGHYNTASGVDSLAFGNEVFVSGEGSGVFGKGSSSSGNYLYRIEGNNSWAIGSYNKIAAGSNNNHILGNRVAIGTGITGSIVLGHESTVETSNTLSIGSATNKRRIVHVADGTADTDAVNMRQLNSRAKRDASNLSATDVTAWKTKLGVGTLKFEGNTGTTQTHNLDIPLYINGYDNITTKATSSNLLEVRLKPDINLTSVKTGTVRMSATGIDLANQKIINIADGTIDSISTEAVNGRQLFDMNNKIGNIDNKIITVNNNLNTRMDNFADATEATIDTDAWKAKLGVASIDAYTKAESDAKFLDKTTYNTDKPTFATKTEVNTKVNKNASNLSATDVAAWKTKLGVGTGSGSIDAYTKAETDNKLGAKADKADLNTKVNKNASNLSATDVAAWKSKLGVGSGGGSIDAYTKAETDTKLDTKADKANVYTKAQSDNKFLDKSAYNTDKATFATKTELDGKADKANVYSKVETDNKLNTKADKDGSNLSASDIATWKAKLATGSVSGIANTATGTGSTGLGHGNVVTGNYSTAVGYKNNISGNNSGAFGDPNTITGDVHMLLVMITILQEMITLL